MERPNWERKVPTPEEMSEDKIRQLMYKRRITYQEASELVKNGQKAIWEF
jgi:shikimate kinase